MSDPYLFMIGSLRIERTCQLVGDGFVCLSVASHGVALLK